MARNLERNDLGQFETQLNTLTTEEICPERYCIEVIHGMTKQTKWVDFINMYSLNQCIETADKNIISKTSLMVLSLKRL